MKKTEKQKKIQELLRRLDRLDKPPVSSRQPQIVRQILPVVVKKESYGFTKEMLGIVRSLRRQLRGADKLTVAEVNKLATRVAEVEKKEVPEAAPIDLAPIREEIQTLSAKIEAAAVEPIKQIEELRQDMFRHRGGGNMNRQILVDGNQSTLGTFTDINLIPGSNLGIAVSVDQTNQRTNFTFSSSDLDRSAAWGSITGTLSNQTDLQNALNAKYDASNPSSYISGVSWGSITGTLSNQTDLQTALNTKISSVLTDGTLIQTAGPHLSRASVSGDISIPQGSNLATLPTVNANVGTFGDSTTVSRVTVNAKGLVTAASNVGIAFPAVPAGVTSVVAGGGITVGNGNPATPIVERSSIAGDITIPQGSVIATLATVASNVGTFGSSTTVPQVQIDAKGRVVLASTVGIEFPASNPAGANQQVQYNDGGAFGASSTFTWAADTSVLGASNVTVPNVGQIHTVRSSIMVVSSVLNSARIVTSDTGAPLIVNSTNSNANKIVLQNAGVNVGAFGTGTNLPLVVSDETGTQRFFFTNTGRVAVGLNASNTPTSSLEVRHNNLITTPLQAAGVAVLNATSATAGVPVQISPAFRWYGSAWDTDNSVARQVEWYNYSVPVSADTVSVILLWAVSVAGGALNSRMALTSDGLLGIGTTSPSAKLHAVQTTLGGEVQRLESTATNDDPNETVYQNRIATTNATVTTLHTVTIPASTTVGIIGTVVARRTGGASGTAEDGAFYTVEAVYKNAAGTATQIGATITAIGESQAGWDVTLAGSSGNVLIQVTGAASNNVTWHGTFRTYQVST